MKRDYRVLLVDLAASFGGAEVRVLTLATAMQPVVKRCAIAVLGGSMLHQRALAAGLPVEVISTGRGSPQTVLALRRVILRGQYQVVDAHNVQSILWAHLAALLAGQRGRVSTIHSDFGREYPGPKGWLYEGVLALDRMLVREYINVTEVLQQKTLSRGDGGRSTLIHNAVSVPDVALSATDPVMREVLGYGPEDYVVGVVARLKPVKGHMFLLQAVAQLSDLPEVKLLLVGDGPLLVDLQSQAASLGITERIQFAGFRDDISQVMRAVDCACLPSLSEALPYAILEAAAFARPILATEVGGMATLLEDGVTACLVPPRDADALAAGLRYMVTRRSEAASMGRAAYELVRHEFSVDRMIEQTLAVYDRAVA